MKRIFTLLWIAVIPLTFPACGKTNNLQSKPSGTFITESIPESNDTSESEPRGNQDGESMMTTIRITVGDHVFSAKLYDTKTAKALLEQFPITLNMSELNGNEKYYNLADDLPTDSQGVRNINAGDLMLYGSN